MCVWTGSTITRSNQFHLMQEPGAWPYARLPAVAGSTHPEMAGVRTSARAAYTSMVGCPTVCCHAPLPPLQCTVLLGVVNMAGHDPNAGPSSASSKKHHVLYSLLGWGGTWQHSLPTNLVWCAAHACRGGGARTWLPKPRWLYPDRDGARATTTRACRKPAPQEKQAPVEATRRPPGRCRCAGVPPCTPVSELN